MCPYSTTSEGASSCRTTRGLRSSRNACCCLPFACVPAAATRRRRRSCRARLQRSRTMLAAWSMLSQAERDAAYNNNAAVADSAALIERRNAASLAFRSAHPVGLDVAYGPGPRQRFDLFAAKSPAAPCLVFIHGGYWQRNTREDFSRSAACVLARG